MFEVHVVFTLRVQVPFLAPKLLIKSVGKQLVIAFDCKR